MCDQHPGVPPSTPTDKQRRGQKIPSTPASLQEELHTQFQKDVSPGAFGVKRSSGGGRRLTVIVVESEGKITDTLLFLGWGTHLVRVRGPHLVLE